MHRHWDDEDARPLDELHGAAITWRQGDPARTEPQQRQAMTWAQRLKRVLRIDLEICKHCAPNRTGFLLLLAPKAQPLPAIGLTYLGVRMLTGPGAPAQALMHRVEPRQVLDAPACIDSQRGCREPCRARAQDASPVRGETGVQ